jgi:hypothetical protein
MLKVCSILKLGSIHYARKHLRFLKRVRIIIIYFRRNLDPNSYNQGYISQIKVCVRETPKRIFDKNAGKQYTI